MNDTTLPPIGVRIRIRGSHPWRGRIGSVIGHNVVGMGRPMAKVRLDCDDAMDGHECYVSSRDTWVEIRPTSRKKAGA